MEDTILKITRIASYVFMVLAAIFIVLVWAYGDETLATSPKIQSSVLSIGFFTVYFLIGVCALVAIAFPVYFIFRNPQNARRIAVVLGAFIVVAAITYIFASGSIEGAVYEKFEITPAGSKRVGAALILTYILGIGAVATMVWSGISSVFKK